MGKITHTDIGNTLTRAEYEVNTAHLDSQGNTLEVSRGASLVVAANDSTDKSKAGADYVCDGTSDQVEIQAAIDALPSGVRGTVVLLEGNYEISDSITVAYGLTLQGLGRYSTVINLAAGSDVDMINNPASHIQYVTIKDLQLYGNKANQSSGNGIAFETNQVNSLIVYNCLIQHQKENALYFSGSSYNMYIDHCLIRVCDEDGVKAITSANGIYVTYNVIESCANAVDISGGTIHRVNYNAFEGQSSQNIRLTPANYSEVIGNYCNAGTSFLYANGLSPIVRDNQIFDTTSYAIWLASGASRANISNNFIWDGGDFGIYLNACLYSTISNNGIWDCIGGIGLYSVSDFNLVVGNLIQDPEADSNGIYTDNSDSNRISDNLLRDTRAGADRHITNGISTSASSLNNVIENNTLSNPKTAGIADAGTGTTIRHNDGWLTENSGTGTLLNGNTTIVVAHGLAATPTVINITWRENPTNAIGDWWVDTIGSTNFTLNGVDPGASNLDFGWEAKVR